MPYTVGPKRNPGLEVCSIQPHKAYTVLQAPNCCVTMLLFVSAAVVASSIQMSRIVWLQLWPVVVKWLK